MSGSGIRAITKAEERVRLRELIAGRCGLRASALPDARVDSAAAQLPAPAVEALGSLPYTAVPWQQMIDALVVGETNFFRQASWFASLEEFVLRPLVEARERAGTKRLRIWSAGCATGEEAYSVAIVVRRLLVGRRDWDVHIVGTDVNGTFLAAARRAVYRPWSLRELAPDMRAAYFRSVENGSFELAPAIREMVSFTQSNLAEAWPPDPECRRAAVDLVICRNVLMYLTPACARDVSNRLAAYLAPGGWLAVAPLEANAEAFPTLTVVNVPSAIFFRRPHEGPA